MEHSVGLTEVAAGARAAAVGVEAVAGAAAAGVTLAPAVVGLA